MLRRAAAAGGTPASTGRLAQLAGPRYFFRRAPERLAARNEIPERIAFCCTAAAVRPSFFATCPVGVPDFASALRVVSSRALHEAPSLGGRLAISRSPESKPTLRCGSGIIHPRRPESALPTICNMLEVCSSCGPWRRQHQLACQGNRSAALQLTRAADCGDSDQGCCTNAAVRELPGFRAANKTRQT